MLPPSPHMQYNPGMNSSKPMHYGPGMMTVQPGAPLRHDLLHPPHLSPSPAQGMGCHGIATATPGQPCAPSGGYAGGNGCMQSGMPSMPLPPGQSMQHHGAQPMPPPLGGGQMAGGQMQLSGPPPPGGRAQSELELELSLRGSLLVQQQRRIVQLEEDLQKSSHEIERLRAKVASYERDKRARTDDDNKLKQPRYWTSEEHRLFLEALEKYGPKNVKAISTYVRTRTPTQVRTHAQKYFLRMHNKDEPGRGDGGSDELDDMEEEVDEDERNDRSEQRRNKRPRASDDPVPPDQDQDATTSSGARGEAAAPAGDALTLPPRSAGAGEERAAGGQPGRGDADGSNGGACSEDRTETAPAAAQSGSN
mmetsp:Transcript_30103/g.80825  ORF Transcript_30103/g.80825 Transcript_30103/m.80825 type:complete len:364 (+) Transcript_30103:95-1186(+)